MTSKLPINIKDLLHQRRVEGDRIEYKAGWNPDAILRTVCAFANDFENLGGGYIVIGQDCDKDGVPVFPPVGLSETELDRVQQELLAFCNLIQPPYFPMLNVECVEQRWLMVLWAPSGLNRAYKVPRAVTAKKKEYQNKELDLTEGRSTGIKKILKAMKRNGSPKPVFDTDEDRTYFVIRLPVHELARVEEAAQVTPQVTPQVAPQVTPQVAELLRVLTKSNGVADRGTLQKALGLKARKNFRLIYLSRAIELGLVEMTIPEKPNSRLQKYRLTDRGRELVKDE